MSCCSCLNSMVSENLNGIVPSVGIGALILFQAYLSFFQRFLVDDFETAREVDQLVQIEGGSHRLIELQ